MPSGFKPCTGRAGNRRGRWEACAVASREMTSSRCRLQALRTIYANAGLGGAPCQRLPCAGDSTVLLQRMASGRILGWPWAEADRVELEGRGAIHREGDADRRGRGGWAGPSTQGCDRRWWSRRMPGATSGQDSHRCRRVWPAPRRNRLSAASQWSGPAHPPLPASPSRGEPCTRCMPHVASDTSCTGDTWVILSTSADVASRCW